MRIDARGYICPMPVILVQKQLQKQPEDSLEVLVDNPCAVENLTRFASSRGYRIETEPVEQDFLLKLQK